MKGIDHETWEEDEPPMLGGVDKPAEDNQALEDSTNSQDASIMDEMVAIAQRAKENKRKQQERERNRKAFGQGLKKGFFNTTAPAKKKKPAPAKSLTLLEPARQQTERLKIVKQSKDEATTSDPAFVFPEVQEAMKSMNQLDPKGSHYRGDFDRLRMPQQILSRKRFMCCADFRVDE
ncbi:unnamed protein product [Phytophthora lilii]|uniref:Unnamed protein product n=1 Tax=Phytophthora lilii TaxID=2077276 RepID=A0A9W6X9H3_9STRA|nr:unnamed protein product [Phytophthora lilii]